LDGSRLPNDIGLDGSFVNCGDENTELKLNSILLVFVLNVNKGLLYCSSLIDLGCSIYCSLDIDG
jgi:hypothetical protein